jgi:hypothetical protein
MRRYDCPPVQANLTIPVLKKMCDAKVPKLSKGGSKDDIIRRLLGMTARQGCGGRGKKRAGTQT